MIEYIDKKNAKLIINVGSYGNRKRYTKKITYNGKKDAARQHEEFKTEILGKAVATDMSIDELCEWYIDDYSINNGRVTTIRVYNASRKALSSFFKGFKASDITTYQIDKFIAYRAKKCQPKTIYNDVKFLSAVYDKAIAKKMLFENPVINATLPKKRQKEKQILHKDDIIPFLEEIKKLPLDMEVGIKLALFNGLRKSEIMGLTYKDIDLKNRTISINKSRVRVNGKDVVQPTKTVTSNRVLVITEELTADIKRLKAEQKERVFDSKYLIQNEFGQPCSHSWFDKSLQKIAKNNPDLPKITMHGLRHTHTSLLIDAGIPIAEVSTQLGHASTDITLRTYTHMFQEASTSSRRIANIFENSDWDEKK